MQKDIVERMDFFLGNPEPPKSFSEFQQLILNDVWAKAFFDLGRQHEREMIKKENQT